MSVEKTKLNFIVKRKIDEEQVLVESVLNLPDAQKILWVEGEAVIESVEPQNKEASFSGQVIFHAVFVDAENQIQANDIVGPFLSKVSHDDITPDSKIQLLANVVSCDFSTSKIQSVVSVKGDVVTPKNAEIVCGGDDELCVKTNEISTQGLLKQDIALFTQEISYPLTDKMQNILRVCSKACLKEVLLGENMFTAVGDIYTTIKYISSSEEGQKIETINFSEPFRREIEANGLTELGVVEAIACVRSDAYKYELDKEANRVQIEVPIEVKYRVYDVMTLPYAVDAFCLKSDVNVTTASLQKSAALVTEFFESKFEGGVQIDSALPRIDKIMGFSNPSLTITSIEYQADKIYIEGIIAFDLAYFNDELQSTQTVRQEIPFKISVKPEVFDGEETLVSAQLVDVDVVARRGREVLLDCKIKVQVNAKQESIDAMITELEFGEELPSKKHAIEIYFGKKGDDLWDIAKELKIQPYVITEQNPDLILPLEESENIVIYNAKNR